MENSTISNINSSSQQIIFPDKLDSNLCVYNALPTIELREAFCYGNSLQPSKEFVAYIGQRKSAAIIAKVGYNQVDMLNYLLHLKMDKFIDTFNWKRIKPKVATFHIVWNNRPEKNSQYVLFGHCTTGPSREHLIKRLKNVDGGKSGKGKIPEQIRVYHNFTYAKKDCTDHAISITNSSEGLLLSDNSRKRKIVIDDMTVCRKIFNFISCLVCFEY